MINFCELACTVILYMYLHPKNVYFLCISKRLLLHFQNSIISIPQPSVMQVSMMHISMIHVVIMGISMMHISPMHVSMMHNIFEACINVMYIFLDA